MLIESALVDHRFKISIFSKYLKSSLLRFELPRYIRQEWSLKMREEIIKFKLFESKTVVSLINFLSSEKIMLSTQEMYSPAQGDFEIVFRFFRTFLYHEVDIAA